MIRIIVEREQHETKDAEDGSGENGSQAMQHYCCTPVLHGPGPGLFLIEKNNT